MKKHSWEESEKRREEERRSEKRKSQEKEDAGARKGSKVAKHCVFPMICGSGGSKSRLAKAAGAAQSKFEVKMCKTHQVRTIFVSWDAEKAHAVVPSQNVQNTDVGPLLEVAMSKKCTPLWREAHFEVKMYKTHPSRSTFGSWDV